MSVFNKSVVDHLGQPLFFGEEPNVARFETTTHNTFEDLTEKQLSFFWRPEEVDLSTDAIQFAKLPEHWKFVFTSNLKYQTLLDSVQGRGPNLALLPIVSDVSLENWIETWSFSETIHSRSYTHIMRNVYTNPSEVFDEIMLDNRIMDRASSVTQYYDDLIDAVSDYKSLLKMEVTEEVVKAQLTFVKERLYLCIHAINALEAIRFYVSFACTFNFAEQGYMEGNAKIMKLIARDEQLHLKGTQHILSLWHNGKDDPEMLEIAERMRHEATQLVLDVVAQEKSWGTYLLSDGSVPGITVKTMHDYVEYLADNRMRAANLNSPFERRKHPFPWMRKWLNSDSVQTAAQEAELSSYLVGQIDSTVRPEFLETLEV